MFTMRPHPASTMSGSTAWMVWNTPLRLTSITLDQSSKDMLVNRLNRSRPAALTSTVIGPSASCDRGHRRLDLRAVGDVRNDSQSLLSR